MVSDTVNVRIPPPLLNLLDDLVKSTGYTRSDIVRTAIARYLVEVKNNPEILPLPYVTSALQENKDEPPQKQDLLYIDDESASDKTFTVRDRLNKATRDSMSDDEWERQFEGFYKAYDVTE